MATFDPAFDYMIKNEDYSLTGKVTPEPNGGKARFGINSVFHPEAVADGFYEMEHDKALEYAKAIYTKAYWDGRGFATIVDQKVATKLFDMAVNIGTGGEIGILQKTLGVPVTHRLDLATQKVVNSSDDSLLPRLVTTLKAHYQAIHDSNPAKYDKIINGWLVRASKIPQ